MDRQRASSENASSRRAGDTTLFTTLCIRAITRAAQVVEGDYELHGTRFRIAKNSAERCGKKAQMKQNSTDRLKHAVTANYLAGEDS